MQVTIDAAGRVVLPKSVRDALGLTPGTTLDVSRYGAGLQLVPHGRTARIVDGPRGPVVTGATVLDDETVFGLIDAGRR